MKVKFAVGFCLFMTLLFIAPANGQQQEGLGTEEAEVLLSFRGGNIDDNILRLYTFLHETGRLPTKKLTLKPGLSLEENLLKEKVLFRYYPKAFDKLLVALNEGNPEVSVVEVSTPEGKRKSFTFSPNATLVIPDVHFERYEYPVSLKLENKSLTQMVQERNLLRDFNEKEERKIPLEDNETKLKKILRLNPELKYVETLTRIRQGKVLFPADGFKAKVPVRVEEFQATEKHPQVKELLKDNVYLTPQRPVSKSLQPTRDISDSPTSMVQGCNDPFLSYLKKHLDSITYRLPPKFQESATQTALAILDNFPPKTEEQQKAITYQKKVQELLGYNDWIDEYDRRALESLAQGLGISPDEAARLEREVKETGVPELTVDLQNHPEFQNGARVQENLAAKDKYDEKQDHGYHVAALIGARCNNYGIAGIHPSVTILAYDLNTTDAERAVSNLTFKLGCKPTPCIINASFSYPPKDIGDALTDHIKRNTLNYLIVAAAGDAGDRSEGGEKRGGRICNGSYPLPACLGQQPNVITVTAGIPSDLPVASPTLHSLANYGDAVSIAAPGEGVVSAGRQNRFFSLSGTSQATAFVTGVASLLQALNPYLTPEQIKERILYTADLHVDFSDWVRFGWLNVKRALTYHDKDVVYLGGDTPLQGTFDFNIPGKHTRNRNRALLLYRQGKEENVVEDCKVSNARRISQEKGAFYTVVCRHQDKPELIIHRHVSFYPTGKPGYVGDRIKNSFVLKRHDTGEFESIDLRNVTELIVRAGM